MSGLVTVRDWLARFARRLRLEGALRGLAAGGALAALVLFAAHAADRFTIQDASFLAAALALAGAAVGWWRRRRDAAGAAALAERRAPSLANLVVTAEELGRHPERADDAVRGLVQSQAAVRVGLVDVASLVPFGRALGEAAGATLLLVAALTFPSLVSGGRAAAARVAQVVRPAPSGAAELRVRVGVTAPSYTRRAPTSAQDPVRIEALVGSTMRVAVESGAATVRVLVADDTLVPSQSGDTRTVTMPVRGDGLLVVEALDAAGRTVARRLIGITATDDEAPRVRIVRPGGDLVLRDSAQTLDITLEAEDDLGLAGLRLRYTRVSGSGERFTFDDGDVPLQVERVGATRWRARVTWPLGPVGIGAGDMVVYRGVARDRRPGAPEVESDAFIAGRLVADGNAGVGFAVDPDEERQALSQQMLVLKTERLIARVPTITAEARLEAARELAAEQRRIRAEFVFMMGGEMSEAITEESSMTDLDESHEAEAEGDLSAGRMANQGRTALLAAIRAMSRAAVALTAGEVTRALTHERTAVSQIELAFTRSRYLLRALAQREALDMTRRGTGAIADARSERRAAIAADPAARDVAVRTVLRDLLDLANGVADTSGTTRQASLTRLAERALRADPRDRNLQGVAGAIESAARSAGNEAAARRAIDSAATLLSRALRGERHAAPGPSPESRRLSGTLAAPDRRP